MDVKKRKSTVGLFSANDWIKEACRAKLDGQPAAPTVPLYPRPQSGVTYTEGPNAGYPIGAIAGLGRGTVADGFWDGWCRDSKRLEVEARDESFREALEQRTAAGLQLPPKWAKMSAAVRLTWLRANDQKPAPPDNW